MENLKKKKKFFFPYSIFDIKRRSKSQISIFKNEENFPNSSPLNLKHRLGIYNFSKKLKSTILSTKIFTHYMDNYLGQTQDYCFKSPSQSSYPIQKNFYLIPINSRNHQKSDEFKTVDENQKNSVIEKPYGFKYKNTRIVINNKKLNYSASERHRAKIFMNFSEGEHYSKILMQTFGLKNIDIVNCNNIINDNYSYLKEYLNDFKSIENNISEKEYEFKIRINSKREDLLFKMKVYSICLNFYEMAEDEENNQFKVLAKKKLYLPFKLVPLFYLLSFYDFKNFLSEIVTYNNITNSMEINSMDLNNIINKYVDYIKNNLSKEENQRDITFFKNEFFFQRFYDWIIGEEEKNKEKIIYKLKISFPKVIFELISENIKIINRLNKNILIQILKKNFHNWDKLILFDLFGIKKFRYIINNILIGGNKYTNRTIKLFENRFSGHISKINTSNKIEKHYEFFMTEIGKKESFFYIFKPNIILLLSGGENKIFQKIELTLEESKRLYELSKYLGIINTLFRCIYQNEANNKIYFNLNILNDLPKLFYKTLQNNKNKKDFSFSQSIEHTKNNFISYKSKDLDLLISECLLNLININNELKFSFYYKIPKELLSAILSSNNNFKIIKALKKNFDEIINNENVVDLVNEEEQMIKKGSKNKNNLMEKYKFEKKGTLRSLKSQPIKSFNKLKTSSTKVGTNKIIFSNEIMKLNTKKNIIVKKNRNLIQRATTNKKEIKMTGYLQRRKSIENVKVKINQNFEKIIDYGDKLEKNSDKTILNKVSEEPSHINNIETFKRFQLNKKKTNDFKI